MNLRFASKHPDQTVHLTLPQSYRALCGEHPLLIDREYMSSSKICMRCSKIRIKLFLPYPVNPVYPVESFHA